MLQTYYNKKSFRIKDKIKEAAKDKENMKIMSHLTIDI